MTDWWQTGSLTREGKIVVFKRLAILKIVTQALVTKIPYQVVKKLDKIQKCSFEKKSSWKVKH